MISTSFFIVLLIVVVGLFYVLVKNNNDRNNNSLLRTYHEKYDELNNSTRILKAIVTLPTLLPSNSICYETSTDGSTIQDKITAAVNDVNGLIGSLQTSYTALLIDPAFQALSTNDQNTIKSNYANTITKAQGISNSITVNGKTIKSLNGVYPCEDICQTNGTSFDKATYTTGGNCSCPLGYYPQLDDNSFVKCFSYDKSLITNINTQLSALKPKLAPYFAQQKFSLLCNGDTCPPSANISPFSFRDIYSKAIIGKGPINLTSKPPDPTTSPSGKILAVLSNTYGIQVTNISNTSTVIDAVTITLLGPDRPYPSSISSSIDNYDTTLIAILTSNTQLYNNNWDVKVKVTERNSQLSQPSPTLIPKQSLNIYLSFSQSNYKPVVIDVTVAVK